MQQTRGGMGSRKHGKSGICGPTGRYKQSRVREANAEIESSEKKPFTKMVDNVKELFK